jgi:Icc protein
MFVAQITDTHIRRPGELVHGVVDTAAMLARAVAALGRLDPAPDVTVVTGDLVDTGAAEEYAHLRALLAPLAMPVYVIPGNHDAREPLRRAFAADGYLPQDGFLQYTVEDWPLRLVALDTLIPAALGGELCRERLLWLDRALAAAAQRPTLILMHHPPFLTGIDHMDRIGLAGIPGFVAIVARHPQIERILCGHVHRAIDCRLAGTVAGTAPSTAHQIVLDLAPAAPPASAFEPPGYQLHWWSEAGGLVTHTAAIGDWPAVRAAGQEKPRVG